MQATPGLGGQVARRYTRQAHEQMSRNVDFQPKARFLPSKPGWSRNLQDGMARSVRISTCIDTAFGIGRPRMGSAYPQTELFLRNTVTDF